MRTADLRMYPKYGLLDDDVLKVHVQMEITVLPSYVLSQQMGSLMDDEKLSDIQVKTSTRSFYASKIILGGTY